MLRKLSIITLFALLLAIGSANAQTDSVYFEGCGSFYEEDGCLKFFPWDNPTGFTLTDVETGQYDIYGLAYISGYYDSSATLDCGAYQMHWNTIDSCTWTGCCQGRVGDLTGDDFSDIGDLTKLIDYLFISYLPVCIEQADLNGDGVVDIADLTSQISCLFITYVCGNPPCSPDK